jgi:hypothetical protein
LLSFEGEIGQQILGREKAFAESWLRREGAAFPSRDKTDSRNVL